MSGGGSIGYSHQKMPPETNNYPTIAEESYSLAENSQSMVQPNELAVQLAETKSFEWGFGRNL